MFVNRQRMRVAWGDCDPAGIVFYPNYFRWFDLATTFLFEAAGLAMPKLYQEHGLRGFPILDARATFSGSSAFGDELEMESSVGEWNAKTFRVQHRFLRDGKLLVEGSELRVCAVPHPENPARIKAAPIPAEVKRRLSGDGVAP